MDTFKKNDKVLKIGTKSPVMTIMGKLVKPGLPNYSTVENIWTCEWTENIVFTKVENFEESELEPFVDPKEIKHPETGIN